MCTGEELLIMRKKLLHSGRKIEVMEENKYNCGAYDSGYCYSLGRCLTDKEDGICDDYCCCYIENDKSKYENMYFMETGIWSGNEEQPPRKTKIISIAEDLEELNDNDDVAVLSEEGNWYTIKKKKCW